MLMIFQDEEVVSAKFNRSATSRRFYQRTEMKGVKVQVVIQSMMGDIVRLVDEVQDGWWETHSSSLD